MRALSADARAIYDKNSKGTTPRKEQAAFYTWKGENFPHYRLELHSDGRCYSDSAQIFSALQCFAWSILGSELHCGSKCHYMKCRDSALFDLMASGCSFLAVDCSEG